MGAFISNNTTGIENLGTTTDFIGNEQPGTDIELYRNGILLNLLTVGDDGRYEFRNVPLVLGDNEFRLVFYGTLGDIREERASRNVTSVGRLTSLPTYSAAVFRPGNPLIPVGVTSIAPGPLQSAFRAARSFAGGISASAGISFVDSAKPSTGRLDGAVSSPLFDGVASLSANTSFDAGWTASGTYRTRYREQSIGLGLTTTQASSPSNSIAFNASATGGIPIIGQYKLPYSAAAGRTVSESGFVSDAASFVNSTGLGRYRLSNSLQWARLDLPTGTEQRSLTGSLQNSILLFPVTLRVGANYSLIETRRLLQVDGDANWTINNRSQVRFGYQRFLSSGRKTFSLGGNYRFDNFILSPSLTYDSDDQLFALLSLSFAAGREPVAGRIATAASTFTGGGAVAARVYRDTNLNRKLDPGEELLEDVRVEAVHSNRSANTNKDGVAFIRRLPPYLLTDIRVRPGSLPDPFLAPLDEGRSVLPRPGRTNIIDFPVALTAEVDGTVVAQRVAGGELGPLPGVTVELRNEQGDVVATQQTLFDGFFLFVSVFPGEYTLQLAPDNVVSEGFVIPAPRRVRIALAAEPVLGVQIVVGPEGLELPAPVDAKVAAVRLGYFPTIETARVSVAVYRGLYPERLATLELEVPLTEQEAPFELLLGRVTQGSADNICLRLVAAKVPCEIVRFPFVAEAPIGPPAPVAAPPAENNPVADPADEAPASVETDSAVANVLVDLGRYPSADRADVAWSLLRRLYAKELDGADRQMGSDTAPASLIVGPLSQVRAQALCAAIGASVPMCEVRPLVPNVPVAQDGPSRLPTLPTLRATAPALPSLRPAAPVVVADPVPPVDARPLPQVAALPAATETPAVRPAETVIAVRLGEFGSQTGVDAGWQLMRRLYPVALAGVRPLESAEPVDQRRPLLAGPFTEIHALSVCARLIADGQTCRVTRARL